MSPKAKTTKAKPPAKKAAKAKAPAPKKKTGAKRGRPKKFQPPKADLPELNDPVRQVSDWIVAGIADAAIDEAIRTISNCTAEEAEAIRREAYKHLGDLIAADPTTRKTWHIAARLELYRRTLQIHDYKTCRDILRDLAQLEGLYPKVAAKAAPREDPAGAGDSLPGIPTAEDFPTVQ